MNKTIKMGLSCLLLFFALGILNTPLFAAENNYAQFVNPLIGTDSDNNFSHGNTYPAVAVPFPMTAWAPETATIWNSGWIYKYFTATGSKITPKMTGFKATHEPSPWIGDYGSFTLMPVLTIGSEMPTLKERGASFSHANEEVHPYVYKVTFDNGINTEITSTKRAGFFRFNFNANSGYILIDDQGEAKANNITIKPEANEIVGYTDHSSGGTPADFRGYFVVHFNQPIAGYGIWDSTGKQYKDITTLPDDTHLIAYVRFDSSNVEAKIGTSYISDAQAEINLQRAIGDKDFAFIENESIEAWNNLLNRIEITATDKEKTIFYTGLYHVLLYPHTWYEYDENNKMIHFSPYDGKIHDGYMFADEGFWDVFRTSYPLFALVYPDIESNLIKGWINAYKEGGWLPKWASPGYRSSMTGTHIDCVIADAYLKGVKDYDVNGSYAAIRKDATVEPSGTLCKSGKKCGRVGFSDYEYLGYVPNNKADDATTNTLDYAYDDYCIANMAKALGKDDDYSKFMDQSTKAIQAIYNNSADVSVPIQGGSMQIQGFMDGKDSYGKWFSYPHCKPYSANSSASGDSFCPYYWANFFAEAASWQYTFFVPYNIDGQNGLMALMGGEKAFEDHLDAFFETSPDFDLPTGKSPIHEMKEMQDVGLGQYEFNNQPAHGIVYEYDYTNEPWKTQCIVRNVMDMNRATDGNDASQCFKGKKIFHSRMNLFGTGPDGLLGDEDNGEMSAWFIFSSMGIYPVTGKPIYLIGSPLFDKIILKRPDGTPFFTITAEDNSPENVYVESMTLNGAPLTHYYIDHSAIDKKSDKSSLIFQMGSEHP